MKPIALSFFGIIKRDDLIKLKIGGCTPEQNTERILKNVLVKILIKINRNQDFPGD